VSRRLVIAIDGPSGAGKSTVARRVAQSLGYHFLDSGALYRAVALAALRAGVAPEDKHALARLLGSLSVKLGEGGSVLLGGKDVAGEIRTEKVSQAASKFSSLPEVRAALIGLQRDAARAPGTVAEGRDIGTVVFPDAELKVFLDADPEERATRRALELKARDAAIDVEKVKAEMVERDRRDRTRAVAPLKAASDAVIVDSTRLTIDEVVGRIVAEAASRAGRHFPTD
jgi:cytidylate kinase